MKKMMTAILAVAFATSLNAAEMSKTSTAADTSKTSAEAPYQEKGAMLQLPDGKEVSKMEVIGVLSIMRAMANHTPRAVASVVKKAYDQEVVLPPGFIQKLVKVGLMNEDGTFAPNVQDIIKTFWTIDSMGNVTFVRHVKDSEESDSPDDAGE